MRRSFACAAADPQAFTRDFYDRLFALAPAARPLFPADLGGQHEKMAQTLGIVVGFLDDPLALGDQLRRLGARHLAYGAQPLHYAMVGEALLYTLEHRSDGGLDDAARSAWKRLYGWLAAEMLQGAA